MGLGQVTQTLGLLSQLHVKWSVLFKFRWIHIEPSHSPGVQVLSQGNWPYRVLRSGEFLKQRKAVLADVSSRHIGLPGGMEYYKVVAELWALPGHQWFAY